MTIPKFTGSVNNGRVDFFGNQKEYLTNYLKTLEGKKVVLQVKEWHPQRTNPQNAYFHGVVLKIIADHTGHTVNEIKDAMKFRFASTTTDDGLIITEQTSKMSTARMAEFIEDICRFAAEELDCYIPPPDGE